MDNLKLIVENINSKKLDLALKQCEDYSVKENIYLINNFKGVIYSLKNDQVLAEEYFKKSHKLNEKFEDPLKNLYIINIKKKNYLEAINIAQKLSNLDNSNDLFVYQLAYAYELNNDNLLAIENYEKCKDLKGKHKLKALNNIGNIYLKNNKPKTSLKYLLEANEIIKNDKIIINNILLNYIKLKDENKSDEYFEISKKLDSKYIEFIYNEAQYYIFKEKFDKAIELLNNHKDISKFLIILIELYFNMGNLKQGELLLNSIRNEIKKDNNFFNYIAIRSLREGNFEDGWKFYESRGSKTTSYLKEIKEWNGENLENKSIVVFYEQGIGDTLQFSKYVYSLTKISKKVIFIVNNSIKNLFRTDLINLKIETRDSFTNKEFDYKISLGSLIKFFYLEKFSSHDQLINKNIDTNEDWKNKLSSDKPNVGLVWTGSFLGPNQPFRSIQLKNLVKILDLDINFYCLQSEIWQSDKEYFNTDKIKDFGKYDLVEISSIIKNLDLVISVDTAILHISAILNKETWGIFNIYPDWRWGALDSINPYKSLTKINQTKFNQWEDVTEKIYQKLKDKFELI
tara:strand:+ start:353 stop:2062 length:1710 start_codon:yes stop_codon:yes gene_type:complete